MYNRDRRREPLSGVKVVPDPFEHIDATLRRFKKVVQASGILTATRNRQHSIIGHVSKRRSAALSVAVDLSADATSMHHYLATVMKPGHAKGLPRKTRMLATMESDARSFS
jgi:ribosomal protein S21